MAFMDVTPVAADRPSHTLPGMVLYGGTRHQRLRVVDTDLLTGTETRTELEQLMRTGLEEHGSWPGSGARLYQPEHALLQLINETDSDDFDHHLLHALALPPTTGVLTFTAPLAYEPWDGPFAYARFDYRLANGQGHTLGFTIVDPASADRGYTWDAADQQRWAAWLGFQPLA